MELEIIYNDNTVLTFGKYKFTRLGLVDPAYLLFIYKQKNYLDKCIKDVALKKYIEDNIERIVNGMYGYVNDDNACKKITYANEKIAKSVLNDISIVKQDHKKPVRAYQCDKCTGWHLTSKPQ